MGIKIVLDKQELYKQYIENGMSQKEVAKHFNCSVDTVVRNLKEYKIPTHKHSTYKQNAPITLSSKQYNLLDGAMLGDGCLIKGKNSLNAQFCYTSKSKQHVEFVCRDFTEWSYKEGIKYCEVFDKRTQKTYCRYTFRTQSNITFTNVFNRWYLNGKKIIPKDLFLSPQICLVWYIGDGCICRQKKSQYIKLATNCFSKEDQENILIPQLKRFKAKLIKVGKSKSGEQQYAIYIPHEKIAKFLNYIGPCPFPDYEYKWKYIPYKTIIPKSHKTHEKEFCELFQKGMTYYAIAKIYNMEPNAVKYYLIKNNLYKKGVIHNG